MTAAATEPLPYGLHPGDVLIDAHGSRWEVTPGGLLDQHGSDDRSWQALADNGGCRGLYRYRPPVRRRAVVRRAHGGWDVLIRHGDGFTVWADRADTRAEARDLADRWNSAHLPATP